MELSDPNALPDPDVADAVDAIEVGMGIIGGSQQEPFDQQTPFPPGLDSQSDEVKDLGNTLRNAYLQYEAAWTEDRERLWKCFKEFTFYTERRVSKLYSNLSFPFTFSEIRRVAASLIESTLSLDPVIRVLNAEQIQPGMEAQFNSAFQEVKAQAMEQILSRQFVTGSPKAEVMECSVDVLSMGRSIAEPGWSAFGNAGNGNPNLEGICSPRIPPALFMADPRCKNLDQAIYTFKTIPTTQHATDDRVRMRLWEESQAKSLSYESMPMTAASQLHQRQNELRKVLDISPTGWADAVECILRLDPMKTGTARFWKVWFHPQGGQVLGMRPSTFAQGWRRPIILGCIFPIPDALYGMSLTELVYAASHAENTLVNQWMDNTKASANARYLVNYNAGINQGELENSKPGGMVHGNDISPAGIQVLQAKSVAPELSMLAQYLQTQRQEGSAVNPFSQGLRAASTAFGTNALKTQSDANFKVQADFWKATFLDPLAQAYCDLVQQFQDLEEPVQVNIAGRPTNALASRHDLQGRFIARFSDMADEAKRQSTAQVLITLTSLFVQAGVPPSEMGKLIIKYIGIPPDDARKLSYALDQAQAKAEAMQAKAAAMEQAAAMGQTGGGYSGQPYPSQVEPVTPRPGLSRAQVRPGPGGDFPTDMTAAAQGMLGGGA